MIRRWLVNRREAAAAAWLWRARAAWLLRATEFGRSADASAAAALRKLRRADLALDLWTFGGRR